MKTEIRTTHRFNRAAENAGLTDNIDGQNSRSENWRDWHWRTNVSLMEIDGPDFDGPSIAGLDIDGPDYKQQTTWTIKGLIGAKILDYTVSQKTRYAYYAL